MKKNFLIAAMFFAVIGLLESCSGSKVVQSSANQSISVYTYGIGYDGVPGSVLPIKKQTSSKEYTDADFIQSMEMVTLSGTKVLCFIPLKLAHLINSSPEGVSYNLSVAPISNADLSEVIDESRLTPAQKYIFSSIKSEEKYILRAKLRQGWIKPAAGGGFIFTSWQKKAG